MKALIIDGYVDEPASFGVPPYISPGIRAMAGALMLGGCETKYITIDRVRSEKMWSLGNEYDYTLIYGGVTTPGRYFGGTPISITEISQILESCSKSKTIVGGPMVSAGYTLKGGTKAIKVPFKADFLLNSDLEILKVLELDIAGSRYDILNPLYEAGAAIISQHPSFPDIMIEFDISSGCERRDGFCSFCTESLLYGGFVWRDIEGIARELYALKEAGGKAIRFGRSANVIAYGYDRERDLIDPLKAEQVFAMTREILDPSVFHVDNGNPIFISRHLPEATKILESIVRYNTPGDTISFGVESFDETVRKANNLGGSPDEIMLAIKTVNDIGKSRVDGVPKLLPGINLLYGLPAQNRQSFDIDFENLKLIVENGLLTRRINIRQTMVFNSTPLSNMKRARIDHRYYERQKRRVRLEIDHLMLKKVFPLGSIIRGVKPEFREGQIYFGRPLGTYPILVGSPVPFNEKTDFSVIDYGMRSVTGLPVGTEINSLGERELKFIPGIGTDRAKRIVFVRPSSKTELMDIVGREAMETMAKIRLKIGGDEVL